MHRELVRRAALLGCALASVGLFFAAPSALVVLTAGSFDKDQARAESSSLRCANSRNWRSALRAHAGVGNGPGTVGGLGQRGLGLG